MIYSVSHINICSVNLLEMMLEMKSWCGSGACRVTQFWRTNVILDALLAGTAEHKLANSLQHGK